MLENLNIALLITAIGMGLVFGSILALWAVMALLMRLTAERNQPEPVEAPVIETDVNASALRAKAAAAAVAVALQRESEDEPHEFPLPPTALVSAWQAVTRANIIRKRGQVR